MPRPDEVQAPPRAHAVKHRVGRLAAHPCTMAHARSHADKNTQHITQRYGVDSGPMCSGDSGAGTKPATVIFRIGSFGSSPENGRSRLTSFRVGVSLHGIGRNLVQSGWRVETKLAMTLPGLLGRENPTFLEFRESRQISRFQTFEERIPGSMSGPVSGRCEVALRSS